MIIEATNILKTKKTEQVKKERQYRSRQGRSDRQYSGSLKAIFFAFVALIITVIITIIL